MRAAYDSRRHRPRYRAEAIVPNTGQLVFLRESSPYSLASMEGLGGFSLKKIVSKVGAGIKKGVEESVRVVKQVAVVQANLMTAGLASRYTGMAKWSGTKEIGEISSKVSTGIAIAAAAVGGGVLLAGALAPAAGAAGASTAAASVGTTAAVAPASGGIFSGVTAGGILGGIAKAGVPLATALITQKLRGQAQATETAGVVPGAAGYVPIGAYVPGQGGFMPIPFSGGGGGGGGMPGQYGEPGMESNMLPLLLIGAFGVLLLKGGK